VAHAAHGCTTTAAEIAHQLQTLKTYVIDLRTFWHGVSAQTFEALMIDWDVYAGMLHQALLGIGDGLRGNWVNYSQSEADNIRNLKQVEGALPGAPNARLD
jgi:uncharacterized protein YukE